MQLLVWALLAATSVRASPQFHNLQPTSGLNQRPSPNFQQHRFQQQQQQEFEQQQFEQQQQAFQQEPSHLRAEGVSRAGCDGALDDVQLEDIKRIIDNPSLYNFYKACILGSNTASLKCTCSGWELRSECHLFQRIFIILA
jgi:hypothetical protein